MKGVICIATSCRQALIQINFLWGKWESFKFKTWKWDTKCCNVTNEHYNFMKMFDSSSFSPIRNLYTPYATWGKNVISSNTQIHYMIYFWKERWWSLLHLIHDRISIKRNQMLRIVSILFFCLFMEVLREWTCNICLIWHLMKEKMWK